MDKKVRDYLDKLHPEFKGLNESEILRNSKVLAEVDFLTKNADRFDKYFSMGDAPIDENIMKIAMKGIKADVYFERMHPNFKNYSMREQYYAVFDRNFISNNLDSLENYYSLSSNELGGSEYSDEDNFKEAVKKTKVDAYFRLLHPDYDSLSDVDKFYRLDIIRDRDFLNTNIDAVDNMYKLNLGTGEFGESEAIKDAMMHARVEKYFDLLHPDYKDKSDVEKFEDMNSLRDKSFIISNLSEIENHYYELGNSDSSKFMEGATDQEKMAKAFEEVRKQKEKRNEEVVQDRTDDKQQNQEDEGR